MGRSIARFFLPGQTPSAVLSAANAYGASGGMHTAAGSGNQVTLIKGSMWVTGKRVLTVGAWDTQGGANVQVEAYLEGWKEFSADPKTFVGRFPRQDIWRIASGFVASLGVNPEAVFVHTSTTNYKWKPPNGPSP